jgi:membrane protease YdiL (CAAX protease family)
MTQHDLTVRDSQGWLIPHLKGHLLLFDPQPPATYDSASGLRLLAIFILLEGVIGPRLWLVKMIGLSMPPAWLRVPVLLGLALLLARFVAGVRFTDIGFRPWKKWSTTERSYFLQVFVLANLAFYLIYATRLHRVFADPASRATAGVLIATHLVWGFYQELVYRGILQTELVRRWGNVAGVLTSNVLYTFGPLHFYHFSHSMLSGRLIMFAAIFAIGLFFGVLFRRSGNLWIVGIIHGIGDVYLTGLGQM